MISCTEFIPMYSEFFKFLEKRGGPDAVMKYWYYISDNSIGDKTNPHSLAYFADRLGGFEGAVAYWTHTLTEEACDMVRIIDHKKKTYYEQMRHCPSRGMLNSLEHVEPYHNYCGHCNVIYSRVLEKYGMVYEMDFTDIENARCSSVLYEKGNPPGEGYDTITGDKTVVDMKSEEAEYFHPDFHLLGDLALKYCGEQYGDDAVTEFLTDFARAYYSPLIAEIRAIGLSALKTWFETTYEKEHASDVISIKMNDAELAVTIIRCPVIEYMHSLGQEPSKYYIQETTTLYDVIAREAGFCFSLDYYRDNGATGFVFSPIRDVRNDEKR